MKFRKKANIFRKLYLTKYFNKKYPFFIEVELTRKCNLQCNFCILPKLDNKDLDKKQLFDFIDKVEKDCIAISLTGGEPLLRNDLRDIIDFIQNKDGILLQLNTNGYFLKERLDDLKRLDLLSVSLNYRRQIKELEESIILAKKKGILTNISTTVSKENISHLNDIAEFARKGGIFLHVRRARKIVERTGEIDHIILNEEENQELVNFYKRNSDVLILPTNVYIKSVNSIDICPMTNKFIYIDTFGYIHPCWFLVSNYKLHISNFRRKDMVKLDWSACKTCGPDYLECGMAGNLDSKAIKNFKTQYNNSRK